MSLTDIQLGLTEKLRDPEYRHEFFKTITQDDIAAQIRSLREKRNMRQVDFAKAADMKQSAVSRIEQAEYSKWSFTTLLRVAKALDARLRVVFEPAEDAVREFAEAEQNANTEILADASQQAVRINDVALLEVKGNRNESARGANGALWQILQSYASQGEPAHPGSDFSSPRALRVPESSALGSRTFGGNRVVRTGALQ